MNFRVSTITRPEELPAIHDEWMELMTRSNETLPFLFPEWATSWWHHFREDKRSLRDHLTLKLVRRSSGELVGVIPLMRTDRPGTGPLRLRVLGFVGADPYITEQPAPLVDPTCATEVALACATDLEEHHDWDWIHWRGLVQGSAFAEAIEQCMPLMWQTSQPANLLRVGTSWDAFKGGLKRNIKESLRHCYNSLRRDKVNFRFVVTEAPEDLPRALDAFVDLHRMRANLSGTTAHLNRFTNGTSRGFLDDICVRLASRGACRVFTIEIDGAPVASRVAFTLPGSLYLYYSGVDPKWMKYSITTTLVAESIRYAIDHRIPIVHLSMGEDVSKLRWGPEMPVYRDAIALRRSVTARAKWKMYGLVTEARKHPAIHRLIPTRRSGLESTQPAEPGVDESQTSSAEPTRSAP